MDSKDLNNTSVKEMVEEKANEMYKKVHSVQAELEQINAEGESVKKLVKIILNGQHEIKKLSISPNLLKESHDVVEQSIVDAYKDAKIKIEKLVKEKMIQTASILGFFE